MNIKTTLELDGKWTAVNTDSYDGAPDSTTNFVGHGDTAEDAIEDLKIAIEDVENG